MPRGGASAVRADHVRADRVPDSGARPARQSGNFTGVVIVDENDNVIARNHRGPGEAEEVRARNPSSCCNRQFRLRVFSFDGSSSASESYTLKVDKVS
jgi:hypothetical protein